MARPIKRGLDYFPQDTTLFSDRKIRRLINEHGAHGYMVYEYIKGRCYGENGYWVKFDTNFCFDVADALKSGIDQQMVQEIIKACCRLELFEEKVFTASGIITSAGMQARYLEAKRKPVIDDNIWVIAARTRVNDDITPINDAESTQRRGKEIKENQKKENEIKKEEEETKKNETTKAQPPPPPPPLNAENKEGSGLQRPKIPIPVTDAKAKALADDCFTTALYSIGLNADSLPAWLDAFNEWLRFRGERSKQEIDYRIHFTSWLRSLPYNTMRPTQYQPARDHWNKPLKIPPHELNTGDQKFKKYMAL